MDESGKHHSHQTDTITENQRLHVLTNRRVLNNENTWTQGGEHHTSGSVRGWGTRGGIALGIGVMDATNYHGTCILM